MTIIITDTNLHALIPARTKANTRNAAPTEHGTWDGYNPAKTIHYPKNTNYAIMDCRVV
jgi:hypothetical protein